MEQINHDKQSHSSGTIVTTNETESLNPREAQFKLDKRKEFCSLSLSIYLYCKKVRICTEADPLPLLEHDFTRPATATGNVTLLHMDQISAIA